MDAARLKESIKEFGLPDFRLKQLSKAIFQEAVASFSEISTIPKELRTKFEQHLSMLSFQVEKVLVSNDRRSIKALLKCEDGSNIETVLISPKPGVWSACISSQVGCPLKCAFCATGELGFIRNLTAEEITDQVLFWKQYLRKNKLDGVFTNIVYMGMGEPFINWEQVKKSINILIDQELFGFGSRSLSISTAGIPAGIEALAQEFPQVSLAISLHFADDEKRNEFMPINKKFSLDSLKAALQNYFRKTNRKIFIEYILLDKVNDTRQEAEKLSTWLRSVGNTKLLHVNLIRYNQATKECIPASKENTIKFKNYLQQSGIHATIRKSLGQDIQGACGQLAGRAQEHKKVS